MAKAKKVFESTGTFLSFPGLSPITLSADELRFGSTTEMTAQDLLEASAFSRTANQLPRSSIAPIDEGVYLWDVYRDVLQTAQVASGTMGAAQKAAYDSALKLLYIAGEGGLRTDSEKFRTYKQHRDAVFEAEEEYKNQQLTAEAASDAAAREKWTTVDEPRLRQLVQERKSAWEAQGFKAEIAAAQLVEAAGAASAPSAVWAEWRGSFVDDLDLLTDTNQLRFALTGYSPTDILDNDNWPRFTLTHDEMTELAKQAPPELSGIFTVGSSNSEIESVSFEYRSIAVVRSWFRTALFKARFWRFADGAEPLSDGTDLGVGRLPAYVSAMVFARNVVIKRRESSGGTSEESGNGSMMLKLDSALISPQLGQLLVRAQPRPMTSEPGPLLEVASPAVVDLGRVALRLRSSSFAGAHVSPLPAAHAVARPSPVGGLRLRTLIARPILADVMATTVATVPPAEPAAPAAPAEPAPSDEIIVLAFICKRLSRSPDPDPALTWD